jgi:hypothetical protein
LTYYIMRTQEAKSMNFYRRGQLGSLVVMAVLVSACGAASSEETVAGPGMTDLAPTYDARPADEGSAATDRPRTKTGVTRSGSGEKPTGRKARPRADATAAKPARGGRTAAPAPKAVASAPGPVRVSDPAGDLSRGLDGAPNFADVVAVQLSRGDGVVEVRTIFAGTVPTRQRDDNGMNVASFYDVDDNGVIDYEIWASLADNGWGTGHLDRREEKASFGPATGIEVSVDGNTLVTRFPAERIGGAADFHWSAASEWGSFESMAASTTARDYAPDEGYVDYPG